MSVLEGSSISYHFVRHGCAYSGLLPQNYSNNPGDQLSQNIGALHEPSVLNQGIVAAIAISNNTCGVWTMYFYMGSFKSVLEAPGTNILRLLYFVEALLFCDNYPFVSASIK